MSRSPKLLRRTQFGNPILHAATIVMSRDQIVSSKTQDLIEDMKYTLRYKKYGVGLAAPQVGVSVRLAIISIQPTKRRPYVEVFEQVIINPSYTGIGRRVGMWEGCLSFAGIKETVFAKALRYKKIEASWFDESGKAYKTQLAGLPAHVFQHETDHLDGILFVERVKDQRTWMNESEYRKRIVLPELKKGS